MPPGQAVEMQPLTSKGQLHAEQLYNTLDHPVIPKNEEYSQLKQSVMDQVVNSKHRQTERTDHVKYSGRDDVDRTYNICFKYFPIDIFVII